MSYINTLWLALFSYVFIFGMLKDKEELAPFTKFLMIGTVALFGVNLCSLVFF